MGNSKTLNAFSNDFNSSVVHGGTATTLGINGVSGGGELY